MAELGFEDAVQALWWTDMAPTPPWDHHCRRACRLRGSTSFGMPGGRRRMTGYCMAIPRRPLLAVVPMECACLCVHSMAGKLHTIDKK